MSKILKTHPKSVQSHKDLILQCLDDKDESIRLRSLDLLYGMVCTTFKHSSEVLKLWGAQIYEVTKMWWKMRFTRSRRRTWWRSWRSSCCMWTKRKAPLTEMSCSPRSSTSAARATTSISPALSGKTKHQPSTYLGAVYIDFLSIVYVNMRVQRSKTSIWCILSLLMHDTAQVKISSA